MKLTNGEIYSAKEPLQKLATERFPVKVSYALAKIVATLDGPLGLIEQVREKLIRSYGAVSPDDPTQIAVTPENIPQFAAEVGELMQQEVELDIEPVTLPETLEIEPSVLFALGKFVRVS